MTNEVKLQSTVSAPKAKRRKVASLDKRKARAGWVFVLPFVIGFAIVYLPIIWNSLKMSFYELTILNGGGFSLEWVGLENYQYALFKDSSVPSSSSPSSCPPVSWSRSRVRTSSAPTWRTPAA